MKFLFHPMLVHFPIAFYYLECLFLLLWAIKKDDAFRRFALTVFRLGYGSMLVAMIAGYVDSGGIHSRVLTHFIFATTTFTLYTVRAILWFRMNRVQVFNQKLLLAGALLGVILVSVTGHLGAEMVYHF
ncbi:MAG: hypothetical protein HY582_01275 [Candidatus Omnitrophica bacterium]|nr:hypothetical protein [Candidatus Omnitrophota bacterium]